MFERLTAILVMVWHCLFCFFKCELALLACSNYLTLCFCTYT